MDVQSRSSSKMAEPSYFGNCPECHSTDGYVDTWDGHWFVCEQHQVRWRIAKNRPGRESMEAYINKQYIYAAMREEDPEFLSSDFYNSEPERERRALPERLPGYRKLNEDEIWYDPETIRCPQCCWEGKMS